MVSEDKHDTEYPEYDDYEVPSRHSPTRGCPDWCTECLHEPGKAASFYSVALGTAPVGCAVRPSRFLLIAVHGTG